MDEYEKAAEEFPLLPHPEEDDYELDMLLRLTDQAPDSIITLNEKKTSIEILAGKWQSIDKDKGRLAADFEANEWLKENKHALIAGVAVFGRYPPCHEMFPGLVKAAKNWAATTASITFSEQLDFVTELTAPIMYGGNFSPLEKDALRALQEKSKEFAECYQQAKENEINVEIWYGAIGESLQMERRLGELRQNLGRG